MTPADSVSARKGFANPAMIAWVQQHAVLVVGYLAILVPTLMTLSEQSWTTDLGAHGPIVLATGAWLLWHVRHELLAAAGPPASLLWVAPAAVLMAAAYAVGRPLDLLVVEAGAVYGMGLLIAVRCIGLRGVTSHIFPFLYLAFLVPPPGWMLDTLTSPLREGISIVATHLLDLVGYPVARDGVVITIGAYQLLVEDACSGLNSLVGLTAISTFYIYILHRAHWQHAILLLAAVIPIAMLANLIRVIALILITHYFGDAVAQGFVHNFAGVILFALALAMMVGTDWLIRQFIGSPPPPAETAPARERLT